jgi:hypothetical protein
VVLAACAAPAPPPGTLVSESKLIQTVVPGQTTKAALLAAFGPTKAVTFDSGYEVWLYQVPQGHERYTEFVILLDRNGVVRKMRRRPPPRP